MLDICIRYLKFQKDGFGQPKPVPPYSMQWHFGYLVSIVAYIPRRKHIGFLQQGDIS